MGINEIRPLNEKDFGFRIYKLIDNGPLKLSGAKEISDFIIPPIEIYSKKIPFNLWIKEKSDTKINLQIYSLITRKIREVEIKLNNQNSKEGILGASISYENYKKAHMKILHVIKVNQGSFAKDSLNLVENDDYLIAIKTINKGHYHTINNSLNDPISSFVEFIKENKGNDCEFFIFNKKRGARSVMATIPNTNDFSLGCDVAYGKLHEFPVQYEEFDEEKKSLKSLA